MRSPSTRLPYKNPNWYDDPGYGVNVLLLGGQDHPIDLLCLGGAQSAREHRPSESSLCQQLPIPRPLSSPVSAPALYREP